MTNFLSKLLGFGKNDHAALVIHDDALEVIQLIRDGENLKLKGINRIDLEVGVIKNGNIENQDEFQTALNMLFAEALPERIKPSRLYVSIPSQQIYPFVKIFSKHSKADYIDMDMMDFIEGHVPFPMDELVLDTQKKAEGSASYAVTAYPKIWSHMVGEACRAIGITDLVFVPDPVAQLGLSNPLASGHFALFSWDSGKVSISLFYDGLLYDVFSLKSSFPITSKDAESVTAEFNKTSADFKSHFKEDIHSIYFVGFPSTLQTVLKKAFQEQSIIFLKLTDTSVSDLISTEDYSPTLVGLGMRSLMPKK